MHEAPDRPSASQPRGVIKFSTGSAGLKLYVLSFANRVNFWTKIFFKRKQMEAKAGKLLPSHGLGFVLRVGVEQLISLSSFSLTLSDAHERGCLLAPIPTCS